MTKRKALLAILLATFALQTEAQPIHPPIPVPFTLKEDGYVTLAIADKSGKRVRNLLSAIWFKAGKNTAWWDGLDDLGRDVAAAHHGVYAVPGKLVPAGTYTITGLVHPAITTTYQFPVYTAGKTPWNTKDHTGGWLANHTAPQSAVFVPAAQSPSKTPVVFLGSYVSEGPDGLAWVDLNGNKLGGKQWVGGTWTAAPFMARDAGAAAAPGVSVYVASVWETDKKSGLLELRISSHPKSDKPLLRYPLGRMQVKADKTGAIGGIAVYNGIGVISLTGKNQLLFINVKTGKEMGTVSLNAAGGLAFDATGRLLVLSGKRLIRYPVMNGALPRAEGEAVITTGLEAPVAVTTDEDGKFYISDGGKSHQVKVFSATGKLLHAIGHPGTPAAGMYDPLHLNHPAGLTIDSKRQLWVAENDFLPKRVSVWTLDGKLIKAFCGPAKYGGGGTLDGQDQNSFYYAEESKGSMQFSLDWKTGTAALQRVIYRPAPGSLELPVRGAGPETPLYYNKKRYFTNAFNSSPTGGANTAVLFTERNGIAYPAAAMGNAADWPVLKAKAKLFFIWNDYNADAQVQQDEVTYHPGSASGITVMPDLSFGIANLDGKAMKFPVVLTAGGQPSYSFEKGVIIASGVMAPGSSGGNQVLTDNEGWAVHTQAVGPFERYSISGTKNGAAIWSYPNLWPGLHASHEAPIPSLAGELVGPTRLLGNLIQTKGAGAIFALNSNHGMVYLFTTDGLFVTTLFEPMRIGKQWTMPVAERGMSLQGLTLGEENFWPSITQTTDRNIYLADGARNSLIKVNGLDQIRRLPVTTVSVSEEDLRKSSVYVVEAESGRQKTTEIQSLKVALASGPITVDGKLDEWGTVDWAAIDKRGVKAYFNSKTKPYDVTAAMAVSTNRLYAAYRTGDPTLLKNSGEMEWAPFKTGGALDLMIGTNPAAVPTRKAPVAGDIRLLITIVKGKPKALIYRAVLTRTNPNRKGDSNSHPEGDTNPESKADTNLTAQAGSGFGNKVPFSSPWRTITFEQVEDISTKIEFAADGNGDFEISVALAALGLQPAAGMALKGDIGILRGNGLQTLSRVYWNNKATAIISDVPSEAELTPNLWGTFLFVKK